MVSSTVQTRILIISDTHCAPLKDYGGGNALPFPPFELPLPSADLLIHCGDLTHDGALEQYHGTLDMLREIDAPVKLVIAGNHDLTLDGEFIRNHRSKGVSVEQAHEETQKIWDLWLSPTGRAKREDVTFLDEGLHTIRLMNGAAVAVYANPYTPEFYDWGFPYDKNEDRFNAPEQSLSDAENIAVHPVPSYADGKKPVDIMITHGPPYHQMDRTERGDYPGCPHLLRALMRSRPLIHCFGHIHEGWGAERVEWSQTADEVASRSTTMREWQTSAGQDGFKDDGNAAHSYLVDRDEAKEKHGVFIDVSARGGKELRRGEETLLVNAAIMNVAYRPINAPWVVDVDLPRA